MDAELPSGLGKSKYRIRWEIITIHSRACSYTQRMCVAERKVRFLCFSWWAPVVDFDWRSSEAEAISDIERDARIRSPLPATRYF